MQYEVSAYAKQGKQCRHNRNYWEFGDYLGIGAGAHDKITMPQQQTIVRKSKLRQPRSYLETAGSPGCAEGHRNLTTADAAFEFMLNALRLTDGFDSNLFSQHTGLAINRIEKPLREAEAKGWLEWSTHNIRPTESGQRFLNDLVALFLPG